MLDIFKIFFKKKEESDIVDIDITIAQKNVDDYERKMEKLRADYKIELCRQIDSLSKNGEKFIVTKDCTTDFINEHYLKNELKPFFEKRNFDVEIIKKYNKHLCVRINW